MFRIIFTIYEPGGEVPRTQVHVGDEQTLDAVQRRIMDLFVAFCRDVAHKPLTREHYVNGFAWKFNGLKHQLHYIVEEEPRGKVS